MAAEGSPSVISFTVSTKDIGGCCTAKNKKSLPLEHKNPLATRQGLGLMLSQNITVFLVSRRHSALNLPDSCCTHTESKGLGSIRLQRYYFYPTTVFPNRKMPPSVQTVEQ
ncbi:hypothetical protein GOBAR_AA33908 [Gossypium barbadense]|uniref:Uncharacterized protein n=1 Tax=Gossypium barbadense TaxID=3634 RepID=A0A2P5W6R4_GOSBA|nr:hypothetical protein GOBAR_AA33908 [Gossypium barbadense]